MASEARSSTVSAALEPNLGKEMITIHVGPDSKQFIIHKKLLQASNHYFVNESSNYFRTPELNLHGKKRLMYMPDDSAEAFSLFVDWLYRSKIPAGNTEKHLHNLYDLYILAEKLEIDQLKDKAMDAIQDMASQYDLKEQLITHIILDKVLKKTSTRMTGLRRFTVYILVYTFLCNSDEDPDRPGEAGECDEAWAEGEIRYVKSDDLERLWKIAKNEFAFFRAFQNNLARQIKGNLLQGQKKEWIDPRTRDDDDPDDRCFFHCHEPSFDCCVGEEHEGLKFVPMEP